MKQIIFLFPVLFLIACTAIPTQTPTPTATAPAPFILKQEENPYPPKTGDLGWKLESVVLTSLSLSERFDLTPLRAELHILGSMPSTCSALRIKVNPPDIKYQIAIEVYSVADPKLKCENVFQQVDTTILLGAYSAGQYKVWVNNNLVGDMVSY
jgi:hypothetical protein